MSKKTKTWLIIAASLIVVFVGVMSTLNWDFTKLTAKYQTNTYDVSETFDSIYMNTDTADIVFALSKNGKCKVECYEKENEKHSLLVEDNTLVINTAEKEHWYDYIGFGFKTPKITVFLPKTEYTSLIISEDTGDIEMPKDLNFGKVDLSLSTGDVNFMASAKETIKIETTTGDIKVENLSATSLDLSVSTGNVTVSGATCKGDVTVGVSTGRATLNNTQCKSLISSGDTGDIYLDNVIATKKFTIERDTGDVNFKGCDAAEIFVTTDTGDVTGSLLSNKIFFTNSDTGKVDVPKTTNGGVCDIETDTGDIKITVNNP